MRTTTLIALITLGFSGPVHAEKMTVWQTIKQVRRQMQLYRGDKRERARDKRAVGRSTFDKRLSVGDNLRALATTPGIRLSETSVGRGDKARKIPVVEIELAGKHSTKAIRAVRARVGEQTTEFNYKIPNEKNRLGHVAVQPRGGALYDMTGTRGVHELPWLAKTALKLFTGRSDISTARKRNARRFFESRDDQASGDIYAGMLFGASAAEAATHRAIYDKRRGEVKEFSTGGRDPAKGIYSCAFFLTHEVGFLNERGIDASVSAKGTAAAAFNSDKLEGLVVYRMPNAPKGLPKIP